MTVVITGGIGSGKSAVSNHFESLGVPVIDADRLA
ncbi:MAG: dephospho-CoA kinase, partial [Candidatus Thiodiazotropha taylori]|nr:dephospho-CoA kinase [Candidatus Thiodiazotropha taylori]MCW4259375.1 dephospho-CoA kinase [Candidatus Thiodiazotropha taylori]